MTEAFGINFGGLVLGCTEANACSIFLDLQNSSTFAPLEIQLQKCKHSTIVSGKRIDKRIQRHTHTHSRIPSHSLTHTNTHGDTPHHTHNYRSSERTSISRSDAVGFGSSKLCSSTFPSNEIRRQEIEMNNSVTFGIFRICSTTSMRSLLPSRATV